MMLLADAVENLLRSIWSDEDRHDGLLSRETNRKADQMRSRLGDERRRQGEPEPADMDMPRQPRGAL